MNVRTKKLVICAVIVFLSLFYLCTRNWTRYEDTNPLNKHISLKSLLAASIKAAQIGGLEIVTVHEQVKFEIESKGKTKEGVNDPVTEADYRSHCAMYRFLTESFPHVTVISEEASKDCDHITTSDIKDPFTHVINDNMIDVYVYPESITIWIDPLDATKEFTENLLQYVSTMVCVAIDGIPLIGVIYKPFETKQDSNLFWALKNLGHSENLEELSQQPQNGKKTIIVSRSHAGEVQNISKMAFGDNVDIISAAGAGYKFIELAKGNATAYIHTTVIKKWDICAGTAIFTALGGTVTHLYDSTPISFEQSDSTVVTTGLLATTDHMWYLNAILSSTYNKVSGLPVPSD